MLALCTIEPKRAGALTSNAGVLDGLTSFEFGFAEALSVRWVAGMRLLLLADALERTVLTEEPRIAFFLAEFSSPSRSAIAFTGSWMTSAVVHAFACLGATFAIRVDLARSFTLETTPTGLAEALTRLWIALGSILAFATLRTVLAVGGRRTSFFTLLAGKTGLTDARAIDV